MDEIKFMGHGDDLAMGHKEKEKNMRRNPAAWVPLKKMGV